MPKSTCSEDGCENPRKARGYCSTHYKRHKQRGNFQVATCSIEDCAGRRHARGLCAKHYQRSKSRGELNPLPKKLCSFPDCGRKHYAKSLCHSHWKQDYTGAPLSPLSRNAIPLEQRMWSRIDQTESCWNWTGHTDDLGYGTFFNSRTQKQNKAYRFVYEQLVDEIPPGMEIDHICFNPSCVRPEHLRVVTRKQNIEHRTAQENSKTGVRGVYWHEIRRAYVGTVGHNNRKLTFGPFSTIEEADKVVRAARSELFTHDDADY